jgi:hypothetical protein
MPTVFPFLANVRLGSKCLPVPYALAYYAAKAKLTHKKSFLHRILVKIGSAQNFTRNLSTAVITSVLQ